MELITYQEVNLDMLQDDRQKLQHYLHIERAYCFKKEFWEVPQEIIDNFTRYITTELVQQYTITENFITYWT